LWGWCRRGWRRRRGMRSIGTMRRGSRRRTIGESASGTAPLWHAQSDGQRQADVSSIDSLRSTATVHSRLMSVAVIVAKAAAASFSPCPHPPICLALSLFVPASLSILPFCSTQSDGWRMAQPAWIDCVDSCSFAASRNDSFTLGEPHCATMLRAAAARRAAVSGRAHEHRCNVRQCNG
jgi:hypothetical protein